MSKMETQSHVNHVRIDGANFSLWLPTRRLLQSLVLLVVVVAAATATALVVVAPT